MKRNMDLVRQILLAAEEDDEADCRGRLFSLPEVPSSVVAAHVELMIEAGLLDGYVTRVDGSGPIAAQVYRLTWEGHEFLDATRSSRVWQRTKTLVLEKGGSFTLDLIKGVATSFARDQLGLPPA